MLSLSPLSPSCAQALFSLLGPRHFTGGSLSALHITDRGLFFFLAYDLQEVDAAFLLCYPVYRMGYLMKPCLVKVYFWKILLQFEIW
jgi:hypothetical protein